MAIGAFGGDPLHHASVDRVECRALFGENRFAAVGHAAEDPACGRHMAWPARVR